MIPVKIIVIGSEILLGEVQDTNTYWLCKRITELGGRVERAVGIPDDLDIISGELKRSLSKKCIVLTSGGLGPTQDDITLRAVSLPLGRELKLNEEAYQMVKNRYKKLASAGKVDSSLMSEARKKMAMFPEGGVPLYNSVGTAPGLYLEYGNHRLFCLPGVPDELKSIFRNSVRPIFSDIFAKDFYLKKELVIDSNDESKLAPILRQISERWPNVYIKSRPQGFGKDQRLLVSISMTGGEGRVKETIGQVMDDLNGKLDIREVN